MGHRKKNAPRRGSLAYLPRGRASRPKGRIRFWPEVEGGPTLLGFAGYKAGTTHIFIIEDRQRSPNFGKEVACPVTVIDAPPMLVCSLRAYTKDVNGLRTLSECWAADLPKDFDRLKVVLKKGNSEDGLKKIEANLDKIVEFRVIMATQPRLAGVPKKKPDLMEVKIGGGTIGEQFEYAKNILGKTISVEEVFKEGQFIDVIAVTKGKGWQGVVKRWGVRILQDKSNKTKRGIGTLGAWGPGRVLYTVPRAGQMGYHQRTEFNKRILKIGKEITLAGGFLRYGQVKGPYVMVKGSVPGPAKRLIRMRYPARPPKIAVQAPQITYVSLASPQGA
ncbi:MAG: 50S ribosomal protein L3 [Nitrososphaerota archaeon]|nr:50S ribosomal protein L3 [Candidatus Bathyarchaeota archaeon]MDW8048186.1 50S ribosomal protein L3 [Nitrososphaerota archaeon]